MLAIGCTGYHDDALGTFEADYGICRETLTITYADDGGQLYTQVFECPDGRKVENEGAWVWNEESRSVMLVGALEMPFPVPADGRPRPQPLWSIRAPRAWSGGTLMEINAKAGWAYRKTAEDDQLASQPPVVAPPPRSTTGNIVQAGSITVHPYPGDELPRNGGILLGGYNEMVEDQSGRVAPGASLWQLAALAWDIESRNPRLVSTTGLSIPLHVEARTEDHLLHGGEGRWARVLLLPGGPLAPGEHVELLVDGYAPGQLFAMQRQFPGEVARIAWTVSDADAEPPPVEAVTRSTR